jgi:endonuclease YncB( thermonuclease family)
VKNVYESVHTQNMRKIAITFVFLAAGCAAPIAVESETLPATSIYWSDGDSGRIDGMKFRLANIDAPETGGIGSIGGAKCELERERGFEAKAFIVETTRGKAIRVTKPYGPDRYDREVVDLSVEGESLAAIGIEAGHIKPWPHKGRRALQPKPDWCALSKIAD